MELRRTLRMGDFTFHVLRLAKGGAYSWISSFVKDSRAKDLGANDYITKPFNAGELMARINRIFRETEERV